MESKVAVTQEDTNIPEELECMICGEIFDKAVSLKACGHTFCSICIRSHWLITSRPGIHHQSKKECPLCRLAVGNDVNKALVVNREIQLAVKAFKTASLPLPSSAKTAINKNDLPIKKRIQSRNYSGMQKNGKRELQNVCKEYNLPFFGNEQELVDRLRSFECMWNAELDTVDTPITPSELVVKFKKKERIQREEKSRDIMTGKINDSKYMKKLTSSLLDNENRRNDKTVSSTSSGNLHFDVKFNSNFSSLIEEGRRRMKKESYRPSSLGRRIYEDDNIHDNSEQNTDENVSHEHKNSPKISTITGTISSNESLEIKSSVGDMLSQEKRQLFNPYKSKRKRMIPESLSTQIASSTALDRHISTRPTSVTPTLTPLRPSPSPKETRIYNPYKKNQLQRNYRTCSPGSSVIRHNVSRQNFESDHSTPISNFHNAFHRRQNTVNINRVRTPLVQADNTKPAANTNREIEDDGRLRGIRSVENGSTDDCTESTILTPTQKKILLRNPYKSSGWKKTYQQKPSDME